VLPLFEIVGTGNSIPEAGYDGFIFTSKNSVEVLKKRNWQPENKEASAFCVGEKTAEAAKSLGFSNTFCANGGGAALSKLIGGMNLQGCRLLYFSTPDRSFDMAGSVKSDDIIVDTVDIYRANPITPTNQTLKNTIETVLDGCIFVYSALSAQHLAQTLETINQSSLLKGCILVGISAQAVKPLEHIEWKEIFIAEKPDEAHMISLLG
jgi:uroporphyrinogen-III synthase